MPWYRYGLGARANTRSLQFASGSTFGVASRARCIALSFHAVPCGSPFLEGCQASCAPLAVGGSHRMSRRSHPYAELLIFLTIGPAVLHPPPPRHPLSLR